MLIYPSPFSNHIYFLCLWVSFWFVNKIIFKWSFLTSEIYDQWMAQVWKVISQTLYGLFRSCKAGKEDNVLEIWY